jgi:CHAT domain-containing protein
LEAAAVREPSSAVLSDLAAAYLALSEADQGWLRIDAMVAAIRAVEREPQAPSAAFNLALILERLSLVHEAIHAWERYLSLADDEDWRQEAFRHLAQLRGPTSFDRWKTVATRLDMIAQTGNQKLLEQWARQFPGQLKEQLETKMLPAWAEALGQPAAGAWLAAAKEVATALAGTGDRLYVDAIDAIESQPAASQSLADGYRTYARGLALKGDCSLAEPAFEQARRSLSVGGSPLAQAAQLQQLVCLYRRNPREAEASLAELASSVNGEAYPALLAKTEAMQGLCALVDGRHSQAAALYKHAILLLERVGETDIMRLQGMLDEAYRFLGDRSSAWRYRLAALQGATAAGDRRIRHAVLAGLSQELIETNRREAAQMVLTEMLANARAWSEPGAEAETLLRRIQLNLLNGAGQEAAGDIASCRQLVKQIRQPADRKRLETELMVASAEERLTTSPAEALQSFLTAAPRLEASGVGLLLPRALLGLARAQISVGATEAAATTFGRALQIFETRREAISGERLRISFFSTAQASFDAMVRFQALDRHDARAAFTDAERTRARALRDHLAARIGWKEPLPLDEELRRIPPNVSVFTYSVLPEVLLVWHLRQGSLQMHVLPATRTEVSEVVRAFRIALTGSRSQEGRAIAAKAFDVLLRPALDGIPPGEDLVFVPDRELFQIPFSALFDTTRGRFLIEDHTCLVAPSLELYLASQHRKAAPRQLHRVLAVGAPALDREKFPFLPDLPAARGETPAIAALYKEGLSLVGEEATRQRILEELSGTEVLHLAAHVVVEPRNPLDSLVAVAGADRALLRAADFNTERLAGIQLVFLAACDTAPGFADGDREGVAGLARAFLASSVPDVVATLWAVADRPSSQLAQIFHARMLAGETPEQALRSAQLSTLADQSSSTPFAWAPFQLFRGL